MLARVWKSRRTPACLSAVALLVILATGATWWHLRSAALRTSLAAAPLQASTENAATTAPRSAIRLVAAEDDEAAPAQTLLPCPQAPAPLVSQQVAAPPHVALTPTAPTPTALTPIAVEAGARGASLVPDVSLVAASSAPATQRTPARFSSNTLAFRDAPEPPEPVQPAEAPVAGANHGKLASSSNPSCPFTGEVGFGRIDDPCYGDDPTLHDRVSSMCAANHPRYYFERPFGTYFRSAMNQQICNGIADQMVLYHYDFRDGEQAAELTLRGKYQLTKFATRLLSCGYPILIQDTPANPALADTRRQSVLTALADLDPALANVEASVVIGRPRPPGLRGVEAQIIDDNNLQQTEARGTLGPGADADYNSGSSGGTIPTIP